MRQLARPTNQPSLFRKSAAFEIIVLEISSPCIPASRYWKSGRGDITNGGLQTIRSKVSFDTGSNNEPCRKSILIFEATALNSPAVSARRLVSVATTSSAEI